MNSLFESAFHHAPVPSALFADDGRFLRVNPALCALLQYSEQELLALRFQDVTHPDDASADALWLARFNRGEIRTARWDKRYVRKDGEPVWVDLSATLFEQEDGGRCIVGQIQDLTPRMAAEEALIAAHAEAVRLAGIKARFIANMSHEIRTPLTAIIGFTELSRRIEDLPPKASRNLERIHSAGEILIALVNDILDFTKLEAGVVVISPKPVDVAALVESVAQIFDPQAAAKGLVLERRFETPPGLRLSLDPERLRQVLVNLVGNAIKYTRTGAVTVSLAHDAQLLTLSIQDTGPGIAPEQQDRLFLRFSQIEAPSAGELGGVGLGLSICKGLVEAMGGRIELDSAVGRGSTFSLSLPAPLAEAPDARAPVATLGDARGVRVLVVDDNPANRDLARTALTALGVEVLEARDGAEGVEVAGRETVDLILMDIRMPVMSGRDALYRIRTEAGPNATAAIIAFTADTLFEPVLGCRRFDGVLHKPITLQDLATCLRDHLPARV